MPDPLGRPKVAWTCFYYWLIQPLREQFHDSAEASPVVCVPITIENGSVELGLFIDANGVPEYARVTIPDLADERIPEELLPMLQAVREHLLSTLRLTFHPETEFFERPIWTFTEDLRIIVSA